MSKETYEDEVAAILKLATEMSAVLDDKDRLIIVNALAASTSKAIHLSFAPGEYLSEFARNVLTYSDEESMEKLRRKYAEEIRKQ